MSGPGTSRRVAVAGGTGVVGRRVVAALAEAGAEPVVLARAAGVDLVSGTVVVMRHPENGYVVKRVGEVSSLDVELTSLNPSYPPIRVPRDESLVLGTVVLTWCTHGAERR